MIDQLVKDCLAIDDFDYDNSMVELGAESIDILDLKFRIKKAYNVEVDIELTSTIREITIDIERKLNNVGDGTS